MNCDETRRRLLASERPDFPYVDVKNHLAQCPPCRTLQRQLIQAERQIPHVPVPPSPSGKADLLRKILTVPPPLPATATIQPPRLSFPKRMVKERGLRKLSAAFALAAAMVVFAICWGMWPHGASLPRPRPAVGSLAYRQQQRDEMLAAARTPRERFEKIVELIDKLHDETLALNRNQKGEADKLAVLATFWDEVLRGDLRTHAGALRGEDRKLLQPMAEHLQKVNSEFGRLAADAANNGDPAAEEPLVRMALAAKAGHEWLQGLEQGSIS
jgi:hypothetical protein